jgi:hypothetical protein
MLKMPHVHLLHDAPTLIAPAARVVIVEVGATEDLDQSSGWRIDHKVYPVIALQARQTHIYKCGEQGKSATSPPRFAEHTALIAAGWTFDRTAIDHDLIVLSADCRGAIPASEIDGFELSTWRAIECPAGNDEAAVLANTIKDLAPVAIGNRRRVANLRVSSKTQQTSPKAG